MDNIATIREETELVKQLGERIGYGNMMHIACVLWQESLEIKGYPISGAFIPASIIDLKKRVLNRYSEYKSVRKCLEK